MKVFGITKNPRSTQLFFKITLLKKQSIDRGFFNSKIYIFWMSALPKSEVESSVAPSIRRAKS